MDLLLKGKTALITGGSKGIGFAIAEGLATEGCNLILCSRDINHLKSAKKSLEEKKVSVSIFQMDASDPCSVEKCLEDIDLDGLFPNILVNNVGGGGRWGKEIIEDTDLSVWREVYQKNAGACIQFTRWAIPKMRKQKWGRVITIASFYGKEGGGRPWFNLAKSAEISLMKTLALTPYLAKDGITFNSLAVGSIMIPGTGWAKLKEQNETEFNAYINNNCPMGRLGTPKEVANIACFLSSPKSSFINGACISVDGAESRSF